VADIRGTAGQTSSAAVANDPAVAPVALTIVPRVVPAGGTAEGAYGGGLIGGAEPAFRMLVLENGEIWALPGFMSSGNLVFTGFLQGSGLYSGTTLNSTNLRDFRFVPAVAATTSASFNAQAGTISGTVVSSQGTVTFSGGPITDIPFDYNQPATMDKIRGVWSLTSNTNDRIALTVMDSGDFTATSILGCRFAGRVVPRSSGKNVYNVSLTFGSAPCLIPGQSMTGIALLNRVPNGQTQLTVGGVNADRTVGLAASGVR